MTEVEKLQQLLVNRKGPWISATFWFSFDVRVHLLRLWNSAESSVKLNFLLQPEKSLLLRNYTTFMDKFSNWRSTSKPSHPVPLKGNAFLLEFVFQVQSGCRSGVVRFIHYVCQVVFVRIVILFSERYLSFFNVTCRRVISHDGIQF